MGTRYSVSGALVQVRMLDTAGNSVLAYLYENAPLPEAVDEATIEHLLSVNLITPIEDVAVDDVDGDGPIPPKSASKADWVAYAVTQGANPVEADAATKDDLIATYGE